MHVTVYLSRYRLASNVTRTEARQFEHFSLPQTLDLLNMTEFVEADAHFLQRDPLYDNEKPYSLRFTPPEDFPRANIKLERHTIRIRDIRNRPKPLSFWEHGFQILPFCSEMEYSNFDDDNVVKEIYLREAANKLRGFLGAQKVQIFEHTVRKRHEIFPISTGEVYRWNQPTSIAHVDTTTPWAVAMAEQLNPGKTDIGAHRIQCVNMWKPLRGPVSDWPLALCDPSSMDVKSSMEPCDLVYPDYVVENRQLYWREGLDWWWCSDQRENEAWIFLQSDTDPSTKPGMFGSIFMDRNTIINDITVPHTAFDLGGENEPRESIELRALVFYGGFDT